MKLAALLLILGCSLSNSAWAWRETGNAGGLTEQNLMYVTLNFESLIQPFLVSRAPNITIKEKQALESLSIRLSEDILRFESQPMFDELPFRIATDPERWWVQTAHLGRYDLDYNDELSWSEVIDLLMDMHRAAEHSYLTDVEFLNLKDHLRSYFQAYIFQQVLTTPIHLAVQSTAISNHLRQQTNFLLQIEHSNTLSLTAWAQEFAGCASAISDPYFSFLRSKDSTGTADGATILLGLQFEARCNITVVEKNLLIRVRYENQKISIVDWGD